MYYRTNVLCCKERSPQKKKYSNSKVREENIAVVYYSAMIAATLKVHFSCVLLPSSWWWRGVDESWLLTHACHSRLGRTEPLTRLFWKLPSTQPKSRYLFSYMEIVENESKIPECSMSPVKHVIVHLWLFQNNV